MSRTQDECLGEMLDLLPPSWLWTRDPASLTAAMLSPAAAEWSLVEDSMEALLQESDPSTAEFLLADYERVLGPGPCGTDWTTLTTGQQQALAWQRWTARGGQSIAYFTQLAAQLGVAIAIEESVPTCAGDACGMPLICAPENFVWTVVLPQTELSYAACGEAESGDFLSVFTTNPAVCPITHAAPGHTSSAGVERRIAKSDHWR